MTQLKLAVVARLLTIAAPSLLPGHCCCKQCFKTGCL